MGFIDLLTTFVLAVLGTVIGLFYVLWLFYLAIMNLKRVNDAGGLHPVAKVLAAPILVIGYVLDVFLNVVVMTVFMVEWPKEKTVSERLARHNRLGGWRGWVAKLFRPILDPFDPSGQHI